MALSLFRTATLDGSHHARVNQSDLVITAARQSSIHPMKASALLAFVGGILAFGWSPIVVGPWVSWFAPDKCVTRLTARYLIVCNPQDTSSCPTGCECIVV